MLLSTFDGNSTKSMLINNDNSSGIESRATKVSIRKGAVSLENGRFVGQQFLFLADNFEMYCVNLFRYGIVTFAVIGALCEEEEEEEEEGEEEESGTKMKSHTHTHTHTHKKNGKEKKRIKSNNDTINLTRIQFQFRRSFHLLSIIDRRWVIDCKVAIFRDSVATNDGLIILF